MKKPTSYQQAGVNIDNGNRLVERIKPLAARTQRPEVLSGIGGFSALFELPIHRYQQPILVSSTDGVGTKLKLAIQLKKHSTIGLDLVAMCVNDLITCGAEPLFFLDYYATAKLDVDTAAEVVQGIAEGCELSGASLVGGETAEMPGFYTGNDYDLAGFCVGIVEKSALITGQQARVGDVLIGLASSGPHSNGYSLIRNILELTETPLTTDFQGQHLGELLLTPTRIYVKSILQLTQYLPVKGIAHITGGGLLENVPRMLPNGLMATIETQAWSHPPIFDWLQQQGQLSHRELYRTFNCGLGMVICVAAAHQTTALDLLKQAGETAWTIGKIALAPPEQHEQIQLLGITL